MLKAKDWKISRTDQTPIEEGKNPTDIKVGIKTFKTLRDGRIIIETGSEEEINSLSSAISTKCGEQLEIIKHQLRKARIIIFNSPEEITTENAIDTIKAQNPDITPNGEDMVAKFKYKTKKGNYNIVDPETNPPNQIEIWVGNMQCKRLFGSN